MLRSTIFGAFLVLLTMVACQESTNSQTPAVAAPTASTAPAAAANTLPSLPISKLEELANTCDAVDIIFHDLPISMSYNTREDVVRSLRQFAEANTGVKPGCKPIAKAYYNSKGNTILEADLYFSNGCQFFIFYENGKATYGNDMTPEGAGYFTSVFQQMNQPKPQGGGQH